MTIFGEENDVVEQRINVRNTLGQHPNVKASIKMDARRQVKTVANTAFRRMDKIKKLVQSSNTVDIPEELIQELKSIIESESLGISNILLKEGIALLLAYKHSTVYSSVVMRDALKLNVPMIDNDIEEVMAIALKVRVLEYLLKRVKMSTKYKDLMINRLISKFSNRGYKYQEYGLDIDSVASVILDLKEKSNEDK